MATEEQKLEYMKQAMKVHWGFKELPALDNYDAFHKAVLLVAGADGEVSPMEWAQFKGMCKMAGEPDELIASFEAYDYKAHAGDLVKTKELLGAIPGDPQIVYNHLIWNCIMVARADGYAQQERNALLAMAKNLGVSEQKMKEIEDAIEAEEKAKQLRIQAVGTDRWTSKASSSA